MLIVRGFPLSELDDWNTGMLVNWCIEHDRAQRKANGEEVHDNYKRYQTLKALEPEIDKQYEVGEIDEAKYRSYKESLAAAEKAMGRR
jgi:hypothetical protein